MAEDDRELWRLALYAKVRQWRGVEGAYVNGKESRCRSGETPQLLVCYEYPLRVNPQVSAMQIKAECAATALEDAGLTWKDVDAVYDTGGDQGIGGLGACRIFWPQAPHHRHHLRRWHLYRISANHARTMIAAGKCNVALVTYGSTAHSDRRAIGTAGATGVGVATITNNMEDPWGLTLIGDYAMVKTRHMYQYGTTNEQFAAHLGGHPAPCHAQSRGGQGHDRSGVRGCARHQRR